MKTARREDGLARDLDLATGADEARAREAFARLCEAVRPATARMLRRRGATDPDAEDAVQSAFALLWQDRLSFRARTGGEWYALVRQNAAWAHARRVGGRAAPPTLALEGGDLACLDAALAALEEGWLPGAADGLWLGEATGPDATLGAAAVQALLLADPDDPSGPEAFGARPEDLRRWLGDPAVVARAVYASLCWPADDLAGYVLNPERPLEPRELDAVARGQGEPGDHPGWSPLEARAVCWRLRNGLREDEIGRASGGALGPPETEALVARVRQALPHAAVARRLKAALAAHGVPSPLVEPGLWKRTTFEYALREVPQRQMLELAKPPADVAPFPMGADRINNWLGGKRLVRQLAAYLRERGAA